jgi:hypothetical protein
MKKLMRLAAGMFVALVAGGCAISPGPEVTQAQLCDIPRYHLEVEVKEDPLKAASLGRQTSFAEALRQDYRGVTLGVTNPHFSPSMLFMSGGSQNGAFGAGFLAGWAEANGGTLPKFKVVTGISTGAIMSTFAFLNETPTIIERYSIERERDVLNPIGDLSLSGGIKVIRKGALGDLAPLRTQLRGLMTDERMRRVAAEAAVGRSLYVGAVDLDTAGAVVFDMTKMAARYASTSDPQQQTRIRDCYVEAIMASSTVPSAALPVFIDNRMYIDGGARFGVISDELGEVIREKSLDLEKQYQTLLSTRGAAPPPAPAKQNIFVIVNGTLATEARCSKAGMDDCEDSNANWRGAHKDWNLIDLAARSVSILISQGYRFSSAKILDRATERGFVPHLVKIDPDLAAFSHTLAHPTLGSGTMTCPQWKKVDAAKDKPLEFHPRFMRCLIAYGQQRAASEGWAAYE